MKTNFYKKLSFQFIVVTILSFLSDFLFYDQPIGCNISIFELLLLLLALTRINFKKLSHRIVIQLCLAGSLIASELYEPSTLATFMFFAQMLYLFKSLQFPNSNNINFFRKYFQMFVRAIPTKLLQDLNLYIRIIQRDKQRHPIDQIKNNSYTTWFIPLGLSFVFLYLFAQANPLIDIYFKHSFHFITEIDSFRVIFWIVCFTFLWAIMRKKVKHIILQPDKHKTLANFNNSMILKCLVLFNLIFLLENVTDLIFLFSGNKLPEGISYAEYVHRGAYPLIFTTLIAAGFVLIVFNEKREKTSLRSIYQLLYIWIAQNIFLLFSSAFRLIKYIDAYSLTEWRVASLIWLSLIAIGFLLIAIRINRDYSNDWLINLNARILHFTLFLCCFINFESNIALYNIQHSNIALKNAKELDIYSIDSYQYNLIPAYNWACENATTEAKQAYFCSRLHQEINENNSKLKNWREFTLVRYLIDIDTIQAQIKIDNLLNKYNVNNFKSNMTLTRENNFQDRFYALKNLDEKIALAVEMGGDISYFNIIYNSTTSPKCKMKVVNYVLEFIAPKNPLYLILKNMPQDEKDYLLSTILMNNKSLHHSTYSYLCQSIICYSSVGRYKYYDID